MVTSFFPKATRPPDFSLLLRNLIALCFLYCFSSTQSSMVFGKPKKMILTVLDARFIKYPPDPRLKVWKIGKLENWQHRGWDHSSMCQGAKAGARRAGVLFYFCPPLTCSASTTGCARPAGMGGSGRVSGGQIKNSTPVRRAPALAP